MTLFDSISAESKIILHFKFRLFLTNRLVPFYKYFGDQSKV